MHDALFADAARPESASVLDLPLLEYSIGHEILLWRQFNQLVVLGRLAFDALPPAEQREAIMLASLVCSRPWQGAPKTKSELRRWGRQTRRLDTSIEVLKFIRYRADGSHTLPTRD